MGAHFRAPLLKQIDRQDAKRRQESMPSATNRKRECRTAGDRCGYRAAPSTWAMKGSSQAADRPDGISGAAVLIVHRSPRIRLRRRRLNQRRSFYSRSAVSARQWPARGGRGLPFSSTWMVLTGPMPTSSRIAGGPPARAPSQCTVLATSVTKLPGRHRIGQLGIVMGAGADPPGAGHHIDVAVLVMEMRAADIAGIPFDQARHTCPACWDRRTA